MGQEFAFPAFREWPVTALLGRCRGSSKVSYEPPAAIATAGRFRGPRRGAAKPIQPRINSAALPQ